MRRIDYQRRKLVGTLVVFAIFWASVGGILTLALAIYPLTGRGFPLVPRAPYTRSYDPVTLVEKGLPPNVATDAVALEMAPRDSWIRLIAVRPDQVTLVAGGRPVRTITPAPAVTDIGELSDLIGDPEWIERSGPGRVVLKSAVVSYPGADLTVGGPTVSEVVLLNRLGVLVGANGGGLRFEGVRVRVDSLTPLSPERYRPFILSIGRGLMRFDRSTIDGLGWDWNGSYGVSWQDGSTGEAIDTTFEN
ncbi:MAG: hypothetical protein ACR2JM_05495, partial [Mycobacterium sp.]